VWSLMSHVETDLEVLCKLAKELEATNAVPLKAESVVVDERARLKCRVPLCDDYGLNLMCPPNVMSVHEFREVLAKYNRAILVQIEGLIPAEMMEEIRRADDVAALYKSDSFLDSYKKFLDPIKLKLHRIIREVEAQAFALGYRFATGFIAGSCKLCSECVAIDSQEPCRHPFRARPSMEAVGIDVFKTAENAGLPFNIPPKDKIVWNGLVLVT
jgi:predicted metal-binding protein